MFHDPESSYSEIKRRMREEQVHMQQAVSAVRYAHSRTGLMARFLQRMADRIDPTGEARRETG